MKILLALVFLVGCGGGLEEQLTPCGMIVTERFNEVLLAEPVAVDVLAVPFGAGICQRLYGVRIHFRPELQWRSASRNQIVEGESRGKDKEIWLSSAWIGQGGFFHEIAHILDWVVYHRVEYGHETWEAEGINLADQYGRNALAPYAP
jgi:hypothetical protein